MGLGGSYHHITETITEKQLEIKDINIWNRLLNNSFKVLKYKYGRNFLYQI